MKGFSITKTNFINRTTAVEKYIVEIAGYKILPEEDVRLCLTLYKENGDLHAKRRVFESCAKFVVTCAKKYQNYGVDFMDLINAGNYGVLDAIEHFDLSRNDCKFVSYAMYYIRLYIQNTLSEYTELIKMPIKVKRSEENYSEDSVFRTIGKVSIQPDTFSLDKPLSSSRGSASDLTPASENLMTDDTWGSYSSIYKNLEVESVLKTLDETELEIIINLFGLYNYPEKTLEQVASMLRLKKQRVIYIRNKALKKMEKYIKIS